MLSSILDSSTSSIDLGMVLICAMVSLVLGCVIAITHKYTSKHSKNFLTTITILPLLVEAIIIMVNGNLGTSVATLGAFGLIRFRSIPGTSKEILIVFFAMTVGLACGMGHVLFAIIITVIGCLALILFSKVKLYDKNKAEKLLVITIPENLDYTSVFDEEFDRYVNNYSLVKVKTVNMGSLFELTYRLELKNINEKEFIDDLRIKNGNLKIVLTHELLTESDL